MNQLLSLNTSVLKIRNLYQIKSLAPGPRANKWQCQNSDPGHPIPGGEGQWRRRGGAGRGKGRGEEGEG